MKPKDLFSENAADYSAFRPDYPSELFEFIFNHVNAFDTAWDCGTGSGQAAKILATKFNRVYATDISDKQMIHASGQEKNIEYLVSPAERTSFSDNQFDLITVAQAVHWFQFDEFYSEVKRTAKPDSIIAVWGYGLLSINSEFDKALLSFYKEVIEPYWDPERKFVDERYQTIPFPFDEIAVPDFLFCKIWTIDQLSGYLTTWSSAQKFIKKNGYDPIAPFIMENRKYLKGDVNEIRFPLFMRMGGIQ